MKQRLITAGLGLTVFVICMLFFNTYVFNAVIALIAVGAVWEVAMAAKLTKYRSLMIVSSVFAGVVPFLSGTVLQPYSALIYLAYIIAVFLILIAKHEQLHISQLLMMLFVTMAMSYALATIIYMRDYVAEKISVGVAGILMMLGGAWLTDSGAYFCGSFFGHRKMAPKISPNKTMEGAIGGVIVNMICFFIMGGIYQGYLYWTESALSVDFLRLPIYALILSLAGILGDLVASVMKRQFAIKDFGSIFPGHGGIVDRFDSVLLTAPIVYALFQIFPVIK